MAPMMANFGEKKPVHSKSRKAERPALALAVLLHLSIKNNEKQIKKMMYMLFLNETHHDSEELRSCCCSHQH
ncbi:hypothetical protein GBA52_028202 [Prunus armeniaca]|nr:hypothetical protein GBA52_028202 [Prunus armeniaca]